jgi:hypothetical protein
MRDKVLPATCRSMFCVESVTEGADARRGLKLMRRELD